MIFVNKSGLTEAQEQKVQQPYARNSGEAIDFYKAAEFAEKFFAENPTLLKETADLLNEAAK